MNQPPVIAITGSSRGIGRGIAEYYVKKGYRVAGCSRGPSTLSAGSYYHSQVDVGQEDDVRKWVRSIKRDHDRMDVLVASAGLVSAASLMTMTEGSMLNELLRVNVCGTYFVCREAARMMALQRSGRIVTMSSMAAGLHEEGTSAYSASKSAVVEFTKILAKEMASQGVTCNVIAPSIYRTEATASLGDSIIARAKERLTIKRELSIDEICNVVEFFASPQSGSITGQVIHMGVTL